jgi:hypothetical protein
MDGSPQRCCDATTMTRRDDPEVRRSEHPHIPCKSVYYQNVAGKVGSQAPFRSCGPAICIRFRSGP